MLSKLSAPNPIFLEVGPLAIYYYGLFVVSGVLAGSAIILGLGKKYGLDKEKLIDLLFWLVILGLLGARLYHVFLELPYYLKNPLDILKVWNGGLAIHGGIFAGLITLYAYAKKNSLNFWQLTALIAPGLALAQAIGRFGNYFNQELYGLPTGLPWGILIEPANRLPGYYQFDFFHPAFLYESIGNLAIFAILLRLHRRVIVRQARKKEKPADFINLSLAYLLLYSLLRLATEFIRIDPSPEIWIFRWPQITSLLIIGFSLAYIAKNRLKKGRAPALD